MSNIVISVENLSKSYKLGQIGTGTFSRDLEMWWAKTRGKPNPFLKIGQSDHGNQDGDTLWALKDINFTVQQGEVLGIIGRNGAGKSTLLKILSRVTAPTSGQVKVKGRIASLLEVGTGFHPELTGRENIYLNGAILGMSRQEVQRKFDEIVAFAEVEKFVDTPVKRYSSGMYVRLAFAVAAHLESEILLVDEVLAVGDAEFQKKCLGKMGDVAKEGRTVFFVSHNMAAIENLCSKSLLLINGRIALRGVTSEIIQNYLQNSIELSRVSLRKRTDRSGNGTMRIVGFNMYSEGGDLAHDVYSGQDVHFVINYEIPNNSPVKSADVALIFNGSMGEFLFITHSRVVGAKFNNLDPKGSFDCLVPKLPLPPGLYTISIYLGKSATEVYDRVNDAFEFSVKNGDFYGTGLLPPPKYYKGVFVSNKWSLRND